MRVPVGDWHTYALMLEGVDMAFFDARSTADLPIDEVVARPVLFRLAVWEPAHVEDRLRDHYAGAPNKWVESLRPRGGQT